MKWALRNDLISMELASLGGALSSIKDEKGVEYLWQGDAKYWSGQAPVLFPICGSLRDNRAQLEGTEGTVSMPRHGIVRKREFACDFFEDDSIQFSIKSDEAMLEQFPFRFTLRITYYLRGKSIEVKYSVVNEDEKPMPFFIGGHPGFRCPLLPDEAFEDYQIEFEKKENLTVPEAVTATGLINIGNRRPLLNGDVLPLQHSLFYQDALTLDELKSRKVRLCHKSTKRGVEIEFQDFPYLILWSTENDGPFVALEPWTGLSACDDEDDVFEHKRNVQTVAPGETKQVSFTIRVL